MQNSSVPSKRSFLPKLAIAIALTLGGALLVGALWPIRSEKLTSSLERQLSRSNTKVTIGRASVRLFGLARLDSLSIQHSRGTNDQILITAKHTRIGFGPLRLLFALPSARGGKEPFTTGTSNATPGSAKPLSKRIEGFLGSSVGKSLKNASFSDMRITRITKDSSLVFADGIDLEILHPAHVDQPLSGQLKLRDGKLFGGTTRTFTADIELLHDRITFSKITGKYLEGKLRGMMRIDLDRPFIDTASLKGAGWNLEEIYGTGRDIEGTVKGSMDIEVHVQRSRIHPDSVRASGSISLNRVRMRDLPIQKKLFVALLLPEFEELKFDRINADFQFSEGTFRSDDLKAKGDPLDFSSKGWISYKGFCDQYVTGTLEKTYVEGLPPVVRSSLETDSRGRGAFACRVKGHIDNPVVELDRTMLNRAVRSVFQELSKEFGRFFD